MKKEYIPILVEVSGKKELWRIDVTNLSVTQLIELRNTIISYTPYDKTIQALDGIIKRDIEVTIPNNIKNGGYIREYKKTRKEEKQKRKIKNLRRKYDKYKR